MELIDLNIEANVIIPESIMLDGSVMINSIDCGVVVIVVNGEEQPTIDGKVYLDIPVKVSELENDEDFTSRDTVTEMISTALNNFQEKLFVENNNTLVIPE